MSDSHPVAKPKTEHTLLATDDAMVWATEFCRIFAGYLIHPQDSAAERTVGPGTMVAWFANAIEVGRSAGRKETCPHHFTELDDDLWVCTDCGTLKDKPTLEEHFVGGFGEGRIEDDGIAPV